MNNQPLDRLISKNFKRARHYDDHAYLQKDIGLKLINYLKHHKKEFNQIIDIGCGTALISQKLLSNINYKKATVLDQTNIFIKMAQNRLHDMADHYIETNFDHYQLENKYDLIFSNMALQWSLSFEKTFLQLISNLNTNGYFALSVPEKIRFSHATAQIQPFPKSKTIHSVIDQSQAKLLSHFTIQYIDRFLSKQSCYRQFINLGVQTPLTESSDIISESGWVAVVRWLYRFPLHRRFYLV